MSSQHAFAVALFDPTSPPPAGLRSWNGSDPVQRFGVYRNNVIVSLIDALAARFPVVQALVGEGFFRDMARVFVRAHPPRSRLLMRYGEDFPAFVEAFEPAAAVPYLGDVARLEAARTRACHAADAQALGPQDFAAIEHDRLGELRLRLHPSVTILKSRYAVFSLWAAHNGALAIGEVDPHEAEDALVLRPTLEVEVVELPPGAAPFLESLAAGATLGEAALETQERDPRFDLGAAMALLVSSGVASRFTLAAGDAP